MSPDDYSHHYVPKTEIIVTDPIEWNKPSRHQPYTFEKLRYAVASLLADADMRHSHQDDNELGVDSFARGVSNLTLSPDSDLDASIYAFFRDYSKEVLQKVGAVRLKLDDLLASAGVGIVGVELQLLDREGAEISLGEHDQPTRSPQWSHITRERTARDCRLPKIFSVLPPNSARKRALIGLSNTSGVSQFYSNGGDGLYLPVSAMGMAGPLLPSEEFLTKEESRKSSGFPTPGAGRLLPGGMLALMAQVLDEEKLQKSIIPHAMATTPWPVRWINTPQNETPPSFIIQSHPR